MTNASVDLLSSTVAPAGCPPRRYGYDRSRALPAMEPWLTGPGTGLLARLGERVRAYCMRNIRVRTSASICRRVGSKPGT